MKISNMLRRIANVIDAAKAAWRGKWTPADGMNDPEYVARVEAGLCDVLEHLGLTRWEHLVECGRFPWLSSFRIEALYKSANVNRANRHMVTRMLERQ